MSFDRTRSRTRSPEPHRTPVGDARVVLGCLWVAATAVGIPAAAQELVLRTGYPGSPTERCASWSPPAPPSAEDSIQVRSLLTSASRATVLGNSERVRELLERARELDPGSAEVNYRHARVLEEFGEVVEARRALCRVLAVDEDPARRDDAGARYETLGRELRARISDEALAAFSAGTLAARVGRYGDAASHFAVAVAAAPDWPAAQYNHGVVLSRIGERREAATRLRRYVALSPEADDAVEVAESIGRLDAGRAGGGSVTLALGLAVPGLGHFYSGRPRMGALVLGVSGGMVAAGLLAKEVTVRCIGPFESGRCPGSQVVTRETDRPWLGRALAGAALLTVAGAIEAYMGATASDAASPFAGPPDASDGGGPSIEGPSVSGGSHGVDVALLGFRFQ